MNIHCVICTLNYSPEDIVSVTPCGHVYHNECLFQWLNTSPTCPQCRRMCNLGENNRIYFDFVPDDGPAQPLLPRAVSLENTEEEETIRQLLNEIDSQSWKAEEYNHHMIDFDEHSKEVSRLKSLIEDNDENLKITTKTLDEMHVKYNELEMGFQLATKKLINEQKGLQTKQQEYGELMEELEARNDEMKQLTGHLDRAEKKSNELQWQLVVKNCAISELEMKCTKRDNALQELNNEKTLNRNQFDEKLKRQNKENDKILHKIHLFVNHFMKKENFLSAKMLKILCVGNDSFANRLDYNNLDEAQRSSLLPYCGNINEWEFILIPIFKQFSI